MPTNAIDPTTLSEITRALELFVGVVADEVVDCVVNDVVVVDGLVVGFVVVEVDVGVGFVVIEVDVEVGFVEVDFDLEVGFVVVGVVGVVIGFVVV